MRSKTCRFQQIFKYRNTELLLLFSIIIPWQLLQLSLHLKCQYVHRIPLGSSILQGYLANLAAKLEKNFKSPPRKKFRIFQKMGLSGSSIKECLICLKRKLFLHFWKWNSALFSPSSKNEKIPFKKIIIQLILFIADVLHNRHLVIADFFLKNQPKHGQTLIENLYIADTFIAGTFFEYCVNILGKIIF